MRYKHSEEQLKLVVSESLSIAEVCRKLDIKPAGGNYKTLKIKLTTLNIDISHFTGAAWNQGEKFKSFGITNSLEDILVENSTYTNSSHLKHRLISAGIKEHKCEKCHLTKWNELPIPIELNHINGITTDNRLINLEILCPNCHAQTYNYRGKNIKKRSHGEMVDTSRLNRGGL